VRVETNAANLTTAKITPMAMNIRPDQKSRSLFIFKSGSALQRRSLGF
jgi:hypothetical protein